MTTPDHALSFDAAQTFSSRLCRPTHAAYRGSYRLPHQSQQAGRDLLGEWYAAAPRRFYVMTEPAGRYSVQFPDGMQHLNLCAESFSSWQAAYGVRLQAAPASVGAYALAVTGNPADWQPLEVRPL